MTGQDVIDLFYDAIDEPQASSHYAIAVAVRWLNDGIRILNRKEILVEHAILEPVAGQRHYILPQNFIRDVTVLYKGSPLARADPHKIGWFSSSSGTPYRYLVLYPTSTSSAIAASVTPYLVVDPPPDTSAPAAPHPVFPDNTKALLVVFYTVRHPDTATTANINSFNLYMPTEIATSLSDYLAMRAYKTDGNPLGKEYEEAWREALVAAQKHKANITSLSPQQVRVVW